MSAALPGLPARCCWTWACNGSGTPLPLQLSLAVDNLADRRYVASVVVNDGNGRYYEPGAGRSLRLGLRWQFNALAGGAR